MRDSYGSRLRSRSASSDSNDHRNLITLDFLRKVGWVAPRLGAVAGDTCGTSFLFQRLSVTNSPSMSQLYAHTHDFITLDSEPIL